LNWRSHQTHEFIFLVPDGDRTEGLNDPAGMHSDVRNFRIFRAAHYRDKALALEIYYRQARNIANEKRAIEIRIRAERRAGELDKEREKQQGARGTSSHLPRC
jgi:hypothetical protein